MLLEVGVGRAFAAFTTLRAAAHDERKVVLDNTAVVGKEAVCVPLLLDLLGNLEKNERKASTLLLLLSLQGRGEPGTRK